MGERVKPRGKKGPHSKCRNPIRTTLYELIEAIGEEVGDGEDALVVAAVVDLMRSGRIKSLRWTKASMY